jgi:pyrimidine operon attenuation protein/uracil phosphoribosyltransferase
MKGTTMSQTQRLQVADESRVELALGRLAAQIDATIPEDLMLLGIRRRGVPLAEKLAQHIERRSGREIPVAEVTVKRYDDDLSLLHPHPELAEAELPAWTGTIVLVDDVLFTGRSLLRVLNWMQPAEKKKIYAAVLCARDAQEVPVRADFIGMQFDMGEHGIIDVHIPPYEDESAVWLSVRSDEE